MTRAASTKLTPEAARELCQGAGSKACIADSVGGLGSQYLLGLRAVNCQSRDALAASQPAQPAWFEKYLHYCMENTVESIPHLQIVQIMLNKKLLGAADQAAKRTGRNR
jgi:hypothetical protein